MQLRTDGTDGYSAVVLGAHPKKESRTRKSDLGQIREGAEPRIDVFEFRNFDRDVNVGDELTLDLLKDVGFVDVTGTSKGKGVPGCYEAPQFWWRS